MIARDSLTGVGALPARATSLGPGARALHQIWNGLRRLGRASLVIASLAACGGGLTEHGDERTVILVVTGRVTAEPGGDAIDGARVDLGWGGHFSIPVVRKSTLTDPSGSYQIVDTLTYAEPCPFQWMQASASGYVGLRSIEDSRVGVLCTSNLQTIDIPLAPDP